MALTKKNYHVPNLDRALAILALLSRHPGGMNRNEIAEASGCSGTMGYRVVMTLADNGFLFKDEVSGRYRLSSKLLDIGCAGSDEYSLTQVAWPDMVALRDETNITVMLGCLYNNTEGLLLETVESRANIRLVVEKGFRTRALHAGAGWKSILAFLPEAQRDAILDQLDYQPITQNTLTSRKAVLKELQDIRRRGYATDNAEITEGLHCVAAPIFDREGLPVGTLTLSAPAIQLPDADFPLRARQCRAAADRVGAKLGWNGKEKLNIRISASTT